MTSKPHKPVEFNFSKLPLLALEQIIDGMHLTEIVNLSLCSKRSKKTVATARTIPKTHMDIDIDRNHFRICVYTADNKETVSIWTMVDKNADQGDNREFSVDGIEGLIRTNPSSTDTYCEAFNFTSTPQRIAASMAPIISHLLQALPNCQVKFLNVDFLRLFHFNFETALATVKSAEIVTLTNQFMRYQSKYILTNIRITKIYENRYQNKSPCSSEFPDKLECSDKIECLDASFIRGDFLLRLNCKDVLLRNPRFSVDDVMEFLKKWKNSTGDEMRRIQCIKLELTGVVLAAEHLEELGAVKWDTKKYPTYYRKNEQWINCADGVYIQQSNGLKMIIKPFYQGLYFLVWR
ncbi:hypothetical protein GCK72_011717 [Caenorhabditis remanei]|uniref:F-box domain-containing protein n=1 Tax=Caenorhabditis remanei TaxID=31234 RepID=A0A6A5H9E8_CAERE|nr:hypothetical protein GCK72_011717 [Caenorhabditis remanei]KAF1763451.1 hypothetical protein GCK72_011717 [Caenorhabditis remanei]